MNPFYKILAVAFAWITVFAGHIPASRETPGIVVSIAPQKYFIQKIAGQDVPVSILVPPSSDPHTYEPAPRQLELLRSARVYFAIGIDFEWVWLERFARLYPRMQIVHSEEGLLKSQPHDHDSGHKSFPERQEHADPHVWLSPKRAPQLAANVLAGLTQVFPEKKETFEANYRFFLQEIAETDRQIQALFEGNLTRRTFLTLHSAWSYFAEDYGLREISLFNEGKEPKPRQLTELIHQARKEGIHTIFTDPRSSHQIAQTLQVQLKGRQIMLDHLREDWRESILEAAQEIAGSLK